MEYRKKNKGLNIFTGSSGGAIYAETLNLAVHEFCSYLCEPAKVKGKEGYAAKVLKAVYEPAGYKPKFPESYERGIRDTEQGNMMGCRC